MTTLASEEEEEEEAARTEVALCNCCSKLTEPEVFAEEEAAQRPELRFCLGFCWGLASEEVIPEMEKHCDQIKQYRILCELI